MPSVCYERIWRRFSFITNSKGNNVYLHTQTLNVTHFVYYFVKHTNGQKTLKIKKIKKLEK